MPRLIVLVALFLASGCAEFPAFDAAITPAGRAAPYPVIAPLEDLPVATDATAAEQDIATLQARAAALRARAARLRATPVSG